MIDSWIEEINKEKFEEVTKKFPEVYLKGNEIGLRKSLPFKKVYELAVLLQECIIKGWVEIIVTLDEVEYKFDINQGGIWIYTREWVEGGYMV